jgi:hypothetical protein
MYEQSAQAQSSGPDVRHGKRPGWPCDASAHWREPCSRECIVARDGVDRLDVGLGDVEVGARGQLLEVVLEGFDGSLTQVLRLDRDCASLWAPAAG